MTRAQYVIPNHVVRGMVFSSKFIHFRMVKQAIVMALSFFHRPQR